MAQHVVHFEIVGREPERLRAFYAELFGWTYDVGDAATGAVSRPGEYGFVTVGPTELNGGVCGGDGFAPRVLCYVGVPDVEAALRKAEELGGTRRMGPEGDGDLVVGWFADPEGTVMGVAGVA